MFLLEPVLVMHISSAPNSLVGFGQDYRRICRIYRAALVLSKIRAVEVAVAAKSTAATASQIQVLASTF